jgi:osmotically-inducible protein OsmY
MTVNKTDEQLKQDVTNQLTWDSRVDASDIKVEVDGGVVTLSGSVPSYSASSSAQDVASSVRGVVTVNNLLTVEFPTTYTVPSDEEIQQSVENLLEWDFNVDESDIDITVENGIVTLEGTVDSYWESSSAQSDAERASGVIDVVNKLVVVPTEKISDELLGERIADRIERNTVADLNQISIEVEDGEVTLSGTVPSWYVWSSVYDAVQYTAGVVDIHDELSINYS